MFRLPQGIYIKLNLNKHLKIRINNAAKAQFKFYAELLFM